MFKIIIIPCKYCWTCSILTETSSYFTLVLKIPAYIAQVQTHNRNVKEINRKNKKYFLRIEVLFNQYVTYNILQKY